MANTTGILRHGLKVTPNDRAFSWLPLYHDMGLVGFCLSPAMGQVTVDYSCYHCLCPSAGLVAAADVRQSQHSLLLAELRV